MSAAVKSMSTSISSNIHNLREVSRRVLPGYAISTCRSYTASAANAHVPTTPSDDVIPYDAESYSYVVVGGGSAGCVLTNRLSAANADKDVLLLEAGPSDINMWDFWKIHMPAALVYNLCDDKYNWHYETEPQEWMSGRKCYWPRGRVLGGSSSLNAMVYVRGHAHDYDRWEREGAAGWSYKDVLPYFRRAQHHNLGSDDYRGGEGPLNVTQGTLSKNKLFEIFVKAGVEAGYPSTPDMNGYQQEGFGPMDMTIHEGRRWSSAQAFLRPTKDRSNVKVETRAMVQRVLFEGKRAIGVEYIQNGKVKRVRAGEVILSGGAINSPQLLMLSGVGNGDQLAAHGIPVRHHLPGVGENMQDHLELYIQHECLDTCTLYPTTKPWNMLAIGIEWFMFQTGLGASSHLEAGAFIRSRAGIDHPDIQYHFLPSVVNDHGRIPGDKHAFQAHVGPMRATSVGTLKLRSSNPGDHPLLQPNYLSTDIDRWEMRQCVKLTREIFGQRAFDSVRGEEIQPGPSVQTDEEIDEFVGRKADSAYHVSCTCKMGDDPMAVVDNETRVHGLEGLRVVDASIMPSIVSGNLNAPTIMIAEKAADHILGNEMLPQSNAKVYIPKDFETKQR